MAWQVRREMESEAMDQILACADPDVPSRPEQATAYWRAQVEQLRTTARLTPDMRMDPLTWLHTQGGIWLFVPVHFRTSLLPILTARSVPVEPADAVAKAFRQAGVNTPRDLCRFIRTVTRGTEVQPYAILDAECARRVCTQVVRLNCPFLAFDEDPLELAPEAGPHALFSRLFLALTQAREAPEERSTRPSSGGGDGNSGLCTVCQDPLDPEDLTNARCDLGHPCHRTCAVRWAHRCNTTLRQDDPQEGEQGAVNQPLPITCPQCRRVVPEWGNLRAGADDAPPTDPPGDPPGPTGGGAAPASDGTRPNQEQPPVHVEDPADPPDNSNTPQRAPGPPPGTQTHLLWKWMGAL